MELHKLLLVGVSALTLVACTSEPVEEAEADTTEENSSQDLINQAKEDSTGEDYEQVQEVEEQEETNELPTFNVGQTITLSEPHGDVLEFIVTRVTDKTDALPEYLQGSDYFNWENLIMIEVQYTNIDMPQNASVGLHDFQAYNESGMMMEFISQQSGGEDVSKGRTGTSTFYAEYEEAQDIIELDFISDGETLGTIIAEVEH